MTHYASKLCFALACLPDEAAKFSAAASIDEDANGLPGTLHGAFPTLGPADSLSGFKAVFFDEPDYFRRGVVSDVEEPGL